MYEIEPGTLDTPAYKALYANNSDREKSILARLATLERRVYDLISDERPADAPAAAGPSPTLFMVSMSVPAEAEDDMNAWYTTEHIPMLLAVPGWRRARRYRLTSGTGPEYLSLHDLDGTHVFDSDAFKAAATTPWRNRIVEQAIDRERRVFSLYKSFG